MGVMGGGFGASFYWHEHPNCVVHAVSDLITERRDRLCSVYKCDRAYGSLEELIRDPEIDAVAVFSGAPDHVLLFQARVGSRELEGSDFLHSGTDGLIDELVVMIRPLSAALALAEAMKAQLETQVRRPGGG